MRNGSKQDQRLSVLIFEPGASGHRVVLYLRNIVKEAVRRQWALHIVTTDAALEHPAYRLLDKEYGAHFTVSTMRNVEFPSAPSLRNLLRRQFQQFKAFKQAYRAIRDKVQPDVIYVNGFNTCDKVAGVLGSPFKNTPLIGMLLGVKFHHRAMGIVDSGSRSDWFYEKLFARLLRVQGIAAVLVIDPLVARYVERKRLKDYGKVRYVPDVAQLSGSTTREAARHALGIDDQQIVVLVYGALSERKGIRGLLDSLPHLGQASNVVVLLAGAQNPAIRRLLAEQEIVALREAGMLKVIAGFLDDEGELMVFKVADIVWMGYRGAQGMSGVLLQAGLAGLPVIACKQGMIGWLVQQHGLGEILDALNHNEIISSIRRLASDPQVRRSYGERGRLLAMDHTPQRLAERVCDAISRAVVAT